MTRFHILGALILLFPLTVLADKELQRCSRIDNDIKRLQCFDSVANDRITGTGKWDVEKSTNPLDDSQMVTIRLNEDGKRKKDPIQLTARCRSKKTELYIEWNAPIGKKAAPVVTRVGKHKAVKADWKVSTDRKASFHKNPVAFLKGMFSSNKLFARVVPENASPIEVSFNVSGVKNAVKPLRESCGW